MPDDPKNISISPEFERLSEECELLKEELAALYTEWDYLTKAVIPNIEAEYVVKIGTLQHELRQVQINIQWAKREIEIIQAAINRGESVDETAIKVQLESEFAEWKAQLDAQVKDIKDAQTVLSSAALSPGDSVLLKKLYRGLAKKLHPDVNPDQSEGAHNLWLQVQSAYEMADLKQLQALHLLADEIPDNYDLPNSIDILKQRRNDFKSQIEHMLKKMAELKGLPIFQWQKCLDDPECVAEEQRKIKEQIAQASEQYSFVKAILDQLKQGDSHE